MTGAKQKIRYANAVSLVIVMLLLALGGLAAAQSQVTGGHTAAGTVVRNQGKILFTDPEGASHETATNQVVFTVMAVAAVKVTPDDTAPTADAAPNTTLERVFRIHNTGNYPNSYAVASLTVNGPSTLAGVYFDSDESGDFTGGDLPVTPGTGVTPTIRPGESVNVIARIATGAVTPNSHINATLTARASDAGAAGGPVEDSGTAISVALAGPSLTAPNNPALPPFKGILDGQAPAPYAPGSGSTQATVSPGQTILYVVSFKNSGGVAAERTVFRDELPTGTSYVPDSLSLNNRHLTDAFDSDAGNINGSTVEINLGQVPVNQVAVVAFKIRITSETPAQGITNVATVSGSNFGLTQSNPALAIINPTGIVFAGRGNSDGAPVGHSRVTLATDPAGSSPVSLAPSGSSPNTDNLNPLMTGADARWNFTADLPATAQKYYVLVSAEGYASRVIEVSITPSATLAKVSSHPSLPPNLGNRLFNATLRALDGRALALPGSFSLTNDPVQINDLALLAFNIPVFETSTLEITKTVDRRQAEIGDLVSYRIDVRNLTSAPVLDAAINDQLPESFRYVAGSGRVERQGEITGFEPVEVGNQLTFRLGEIAPREQLSVVYRVRIGAGARLGSQSNLAVVGGHFPSGEPVRTPPAKATVEVGAGVFSNRQVVIGRVFEDFNANGSFDKGQDRPVAGARIYSSDGRSVTTDTAGMYNFPVLSGGGVVLSLDPTTIPEGAAVNDEGLRYQHSWTRLLRHPLLGGGMIRQNFSLRPSSRQRAASMKFPRRDEKKKADKSAADSAASEAGDLGFADSPPAPTPQGSAFTETNSAADSATIEATASKFESNADDHKPAIPVSKLADATVTPGDIIVDVKENQVVLAAALSFEARVASNYLVEVEWNGERVPDTQVGARKVDYAAGYAAYVYYGLNPKPGANKLRVTARRLADNQPGRTMAITLFGRGPAKALRLMIEKDRLRAGGRDSTIVRVQAVDEWEHPAMDGQVAVEASAGRILGLDEQTRSRQEILFGQGTEASRGSGAEQVSDHVRQRLLTIKGGEASFRLIADNGVGVIRLRASYGEVATERMVPLVAEIRPTLLVSLGEMTFGKASPELALGRDEGRFRQHSSFFLKSAVGSRNLLTLSYDSSRALGRVEGRDTLFQRDPADRVYPLFGDSSTRYDEAQSNSKLYARFDRGRSFALFGDFTLSGAEVDNGRALNYRGINSTSGVSGFGGLGEFSGRSGSLTSYERLLTGAKIHLAAEDGSFITLAGARPDTAFARDVFGGGQVGFGQLSHQSLLPGSEAVTLEVRDRRNPEIIIKREALSRAVDYQIDYQTGQLFFTRLVSAFDYQFNLTQVVVTYEHRGSGAASNIYLGRAAKNFGRLGLRVGGAYVNQQQPVTGAYQLGGVEVTKSLPRGGHVTAEWAFSDGRPMASGNLLPADGAAGGGQAYRAELEAPLPFREATLRADFGFARAGFFNPFGGTVTPGAQRARVAVTMKPRGGAQLLLGFTDERNRTANVNNSRQTGTVAWAQQLSERLRLAFGYDFRRFQDNAGGKEVTSHLLTAGAEWQATARLRLEAKREQNLGASDPTYPNQTTIGAKYKVSSIATLFLAQRLASVPVTPISDVSRTGFGFSAARSETAVGVETQLGRYTSLNTRYQLEHGINSADSFAVLGLVNRLPVKKTLSLETSFERGFHLAGSNQSFLSVGTGFVWTPTENFKSVARYEARDRNGLGHILTAGAAGRIGEHLTALAQTQWSKARFKQDRYKSLNATAALAWRPVESDKTALLFSYNVRSSDRSQQAAASGFGLTRETVHTVSTDGLVQAARKLELYGRLAYRFSASGNGASLAHAAVGTWLGQGRVSYRFGHSFDAAVEGRLLAQPAGQTRRTGLGAEVGYWPLADLRLGLGYNFTGHQEPPGGAFNHSRKGIYFSVTTKVSNLFNLFGTSPKGLKN
jgi:uncharacterized repeat protein (TIGR01451 family)